MNCHGGNNSMQRGLMVFGTKNLSGWDINSAYLSLSSQVQACQLFKGAKTTAQKRQHTVYKAHLHVLLTEVFSCV